MSQRSPLLRRSLTAGLALSCSVLGLLGVHSTAYAAGTAHYVDCSASSPGTGTQASPLNSLAAANAITLGPGDSLLLRRATTCLGMLSPKGSGSSTAPITIGAYGSGTLPAINANGQTQAVLLAGEEYIQVSDLDLRTPGDNTTARRGIYVYAKDTGVRHGIVLQRLTVHDVQGQLPTSAKLSLGKFANASGGIVLEAQGSTTPTSFDGPQILDNHVYNVDREGIYAWSNWCRRPAMNNWSTSTCSAAWQPMTNLVVRGNHLSDIGGDGIAPMTSTGTLVEHNTLEGFNRRGQGNNAGMWTANTDNATFQYNDTSGGHSTRDGMAYDVDHATDGVVYQYNLSHDNDGGFVMVCPTSTGNKNWIIRYNISVHDNGRMYNHGCGGPITNGQMYNNSVLIADGANVDLFYHYGTSPGAENVRFTDNVISKQGSTGTITDSLTDKTFTLDHNVFYNVVAPSWATNTITAAPMFAAHDVDDPYGYQVLAQSSVLNAGAVIANNGGQDYFGNTVPSNTAPNIGAYQGATVCAPTLLDRFDSDTVGAAPPDWTVPGPSGAIQVGPDPGPSFLGNSLVLSTKATTATATRTFPATTGDLQVDVRLRANQIGAPLGFQVLDSTGTPVAQVSLAADGKIAYTNVSAWADSTIAYTTNVWHRIMLVLHPGAGTYDLVVDGVSVVTATTGAGTPTQVRVNLPGGSGATFAADDVFVQPKTC